MISTAIETAFNRAHQRKWDKLYWAFDIHETILVPTYEKGLSTEFYPLAKETLQVLSKRKDVELILYTCSWPNEIEKYLELFKENGIIFKHTNSNRDVKNTTYGYYNDKPYFNILFEDKAGFIPSEWNDIAKLLEKYPENYLLDNLK